MKCVKVLTLILALAMMIGTLVACDKTTADSADVFDDKPVSFLETIPTSMTAISELNGYTVANFSDDYGYEANELYAVLYKAGETDNVKTYKVFSFLTGEIVATFVSSSDDNAYIEYSITPTSDGRLFKVSKQVYNWNDNKSTYTYSLYDISGQELVSRAYDFSVGSSDLYALADWTVFENTMYEVNEDTGAYTEYAKIPAHAGINARTAYNCFGLDEYICYVVSGNGITVYDRNFNIVAVWTVPANADGDNYYPMDNGDILIQYQKELKPDATQYDLYEMTNGLVYKYDLVTEILSVSTQSSKTIEVNGEITGMLNKHTNYEEFNLNENFENLITVAGIVDGKISDAVTDIRAYMLGNDGMLTAVAERVDHQIGPDIPYVDGYRVARTSYGFAILDADGKIVRQVSTMADIQMVGEYFIDDYGIYDLTLNLVYDLTKAYSYIYATEGNTVFVYEGEDGSQERYSIIAFCGGSKTTVYTYDVEDTENNQRLVINQDGSGVYAIVNQLTGEYTYYNTDGVKLLTVTDRIDQCYAHSTGSAVLAQVYINDQTAFYVIK